MVLVSCWHSDYLSWFICIKPFSPVCMCMCVHEYGQTCASVYMWKSKDNLGCQPLLSSSRQGLFVTHSCLYQANWWLLPHSPVSLVPQEHWDYRGMVTCPAVCRFWSSKLSCHVYMQVLYPLSHLSRWKVLIGSAPCALAEHFKAELISYLRMAMTSCCLQLSWLLLGLTHFSSSSYS